MKHMRRFTALVLALVMVFSLTVSASAATAQTVTVKLSPNITVKLDGEAQTMADVNGNPVYPVLYGGTTYLPVRAVGNMLGLDVDWDQATQTVILTTSDSKTETNKPSGKAPADAKPSDITVQIRPDITVKLDGKAQKMTDVKGSPVYPMLYGGTTYLPVRAVSNMLGVTVDWSGVSQTVILSTVMAAGRGGVLVESMDTIIVTDLNGEEIQISVSPQWSPDEIKQALADANIDPDLADGYAEAVARRLAVHDVGWDRDEALAFISNPDISSNVETLGEHHIARDWCELDYSTAMDGYIRVRIRKSDTRYAKCTVTYYDPEPENGYYLRKAEHPILGNEWVNIPLDGSGRFYRAYIQRLYSINELEAVGYATGDINTNLYAHFEGRAAGDERWLMSTGRVNFDGNPETVAKAREITKNCKTDAERVAAVFKWVAANIKYDDALYNAGQEYTKSQFANGPDMSAGNPFYDDIRACMDPDGILERRDGVCEDYAALMAAMLRSVGVPCKFIHGSVCQNGSWEPHAWVAVSPELEKNLNMQALGAGHEPDGWIRLDPTWGNTASGRAAASVDKNHSTYSVY